MTTKEKSIDPRLVSVRDMKAEDIELILNYWYRSPPGFIEAMGVDWSKFPKEEELRSFLQTRYEKNLREPASKANALIIQYETRAVGMHTLTPFTEGEFGIFHAHIFDSEMRGRGLGMASYPLACKAFLERFHLQKILFKTPKQNMGAIRVKEKLGIPCIGDEVINFGIIKEGTAAKVYELTRERLAEL